MEKMKLSDHFTLDEMTLSQTAARKGIDNTPDQKVIDNLIRVAATLERIRTLVGKPIIVSSGYRSPEVNKSVGGAADSAHVQGLAADINVPGMKPATLATLIKTSGIVFDQVVLEFDRWVHVGLSETAPRRELLTIRTGTGYMKGIV
jgi:zinc D-Ala-D-Ala carboxypeptidase